MLTDRYPATWDDDDYIRAWARQRGGDMHPICYVSLQSTDNKLQHTAAIHFDREGHPVIRQAGPGATAQKITG